MSADGRRTLYLDASALVKIVVPEAESPALSEELADGPEVITSVIGVIETRRAVSTATGDSPQALERALSVLEKATVIEVTRAIGELAATVQPGALRTLDAVHLATALSLGSELDGFVVYDRRLADAARGVGLSVLAPGRPEA